MLKLRIGTGNLEGRIFLRDGMQKFYKSKLEKDTTSKSRAGSESESSYVIRLIQGKTKRVVEIPMNNTVKVLLQARRHNGSDLLFPSPKNGLQGTSIKKAMLGACARAKIEPITIRDLRRTFGTRLCELNVNTTVTARLLGHSDLRSVHRYERGKEIMREAVGLLENPAKILPLTRKSENKKAVSY